MFSFTINRKTFAVVRYDSGRDASKFASRDDILIHGPEDMSKLTPSEMTGLFKTTNPNPTKIFRDRGEMGQYLYDLLGGLATKGESRVKSPPRMENTMATKAKGTKKAPSKTTAQEEEVQEEPEQPAPKKGKKSAKAAAPPAEETNGKTSRGRRSVFEGKRLFYVEIGEGAKGAENRRHKESRRTSNRGIIQSAGAKGITFEAYIEKGGHPGDLARDVKKGGVRVQ